MTRAICSIIFVFAFVATQAQTQSRFEEEEQNQPQTEEAQPEQNKKNTSSQTKPKQKFWDRARIGGNFGAAFGSATYVNVSPTLYYAITEKLWANAGITYIYSKYKAPYVPFETNTYGGSVGGRYEVFNPLFVEVQYEILSFEPAYTNGTKDPRKLTHNVFAGGGVQQRVGNGFFFVSVLYNLTYSNAFDNYYSQPYVVRIGFGF